MKLLSAKSRIAFGMACLLVSVLSTAMMLGMVPDRKAAVLEGRATVCETIAVASSDFISRDELPRLEFLLKSTVTHQPDILSAGVRRSSGELVIAVGEHENVWKIESDNRSTEDHVLVPIRAGVEKWGNVEVRFQSLSKPGLMSWLSSPWLQLTVFCGSVGYLLFVFYLGKVLSHLDPARAVPKRVRSALDSMAEGLLVVDSKGRIVLANHSFSNWVARDAEKLIGVPAGSLDWVRNETGDPLESFPWVEAIEKECPVAGIMLGIRENDGTIRVLIANASPVLGHDGKYRGVLVSFDDVTQLEATKRDLKAAKQLADDANQAKSEFLARMSHEIRTPMNAILGYTDVLRRGFEESEHNRREYLDTIHGSGEHLLALINDILDLSKIESGRMELETASCSPHQLIGQVVALLKSKADEKGIYLKAEYQGLLPATIFTDSVRLRQTIMNLAGNAIKFTEQGGVTIRSRYIAGTSEDLPRLSVEVIDTGIGISESAQSKVFEPFAQADSSVTRKFGGTGLGLAISKQLAEALGGGIQLSSEAGQGSTFSVTVAARVAEDTPMITVEQASAVKDEFAEQRKEVLQLQPGRVLVADDGASNRKLIELVLTRAGVTVVAVENGQQAVDAALEEPFDAILMDMQMPIMDGYTASTLLRETAYEKPIIALTAHAMRGDKEKCQAAGCSGFLTKPVDIDKLLSTLAETMGVSAEPSVNARPAHDRATEADELSSIECSLPLDDPDFFEIAEEFVARLKEQITCMEAAHEREDFGSLASLAHWLKGSGGTAGFSHFTAPATTLEAAAKAAAASDCKQLIEEIKHLTTRIVLSPRERPDCVETSSFESELRGDSELLKSSLPIDDIDFLEIVEEFVDRLSEKLDEMEVAVKEERLEDVARIAHWLKGSGGTAGFDAFTSPARELELHAKAGKGSAAFESVAAIRRLANRITVDAGAT